MKSSTSITDIAARVNQLAPDVGGVFTFADLWNLIGLNSSDRVSKVVNRLLREKVLVKVRRGLYATAQPDLWLLASQFKQNACVSMDSALAYYGLIGTVPTQSVSLIYAGNTQTFDTDFGQLRFFKIKKELLFATQRIKNGVLIAEPEKAYVDILYYYTKGARFVVDPLTDIDLWKLDKPKVRTYLTNYRNPKFVKFVEGVIDEKQ